MAQVVHRDGEWQGTADAPVSVPEEAIAPQENAAPADEYQAPDVDTPIYTAVENESVKES